MSGLGLCILPIVDPYSSMLSLPIQPCQYPNIFKQRKRMFNHLSNICPKKEEDNEMTDGSKRVKWTSNAQEKGKIDKEESIPIAINGPISSSFNSSTLMGPSLNTNSNSNSNKRSRYDGDKTRPIDSVDNESICPWETLTYPSLVHTIFEHHVDAKGRIDRVVAENALRAQFEMLKQQHERALIEQFQNFTTFNKDYIYRTVKENELSYVS
ncbi:MAG: hypothetical protein Sylvanvirus3_39 [Sylvanvirus sp.]|uniref:Uncharacterized protein n=1 Tax=Sylvanvirus sp. TaxID=2487774 RepID=A0A3G5AH98_9VIRU|nr:MAG: hypothetical protein Sylvanvirus3_39 [Sylvanvirus sp.]